MKNNLTQGTAISYVNSKIQVPNDPIIPFIEGDGIGVDITPVMRKIVDSAVSLAYNNERKINWLEIYAGEKASLKFDGNYLPDETLQAIQKYKVAIKGPLTTPVGGGIRSLNVALRQKLDLYTCLRPVKYYKGTPSPLKDPSATDMVIFRENSEDIYAGIEWQAGSDSSNQLIKHLQEEYKIDKIRFPQNCAIGIKPVSKQGSYRLIREAIEYAIKHDRKSVCLVHKGNIMKYTEGAFKDWGYELALNEYNAKLIDNGPWCKIINPNNNKEIIIKDCIADAFLQQILLRPKDYDVVATLNLNGDYISDALAAQVGGIGIAPGANLSDELALFEATHGTAPKYSGQDKVNPGSLLLSAVMMLDHIGWHESARIIENGLESAIASKKVTYDFERLMSGATLLSCSSFGDEIIANMS